MSDAGCCEHWEEVAGPEMEARIAELEAENKALWAFVDAEDAFNAMMDSGDWEGDDDAYNLMLAAREALRPYEKKPFTYDPDAPLKLA